MIASGTGQRRIQETEHLVRSMPQMHLIEFKAWCAYYLLSDSLFLMTRLLGSKELVKVIDVHMPMSYRRRLVLRFSRVQARISLVI